MPSRPLFKRIPVEFDGTHWVDHKGDPVTADRGTKAILETAAPDQRGRLPALLSDDRQTTQFLNPGEKLRIALQVPSLDPLPHSLTKVLLPEASMRGQVEWGIERWSSKDCRFIEVTLGNAPKAITKTQEPPIEGLVVLHRGRVCLKLLTGPIIPPADFLPEPTTSLNRLLTMLSELFEVHRKSHTGNIYKEISYQEKDNRWHPLGFLRAAEYGDKGDFFAKDFWKSCWNDASSSEAHVSGKQTSDA